MKRKYAEMVAEAQVNHDAASKRLTSWIESAIKPWSKKLTLKTEKSKDREMVVDINRVYFDGKVWLYFSYNASPTALARTVFGQDRSSPFWNNPGRPPVALAKKFPPDKAIKKYEDVRDRIDFALETYFQEQDLEEAMEHDDPAYKDGIESLRKDVDDWLFQIETPIDKMRTKRMSMWRANFGDGCDRYRWEIYWGNRAIATIIVGPKHARRGGFDRSFDARDLDWTPIIDLWAHDCGELQMYQDLDQKIMAMTEKGIKTFDDFKAAIQLIIDKIPTWEK